MEHVSSSPKQRSKSAERHEDKVEEQQQQQQQLYAAYAVLYDVHSQATLLLAEALTVFVAHYAPVLQENNASSSPSPGQTPAQQQREVVEDLLLRFTEMQTTLTANSSAAQNGNDDERRSGSKETRRGEVVQAIQFLEQRLPGDWKELIQRTLSRPIKKKAKHKERNNDTESSLTTQPNISATDVLSCPSDVVQLALLLRRHWTLERDITLSIPALVDVLAKLQQEANRDQKREGRASANEGKEDAGVAAAPPLSVTVVLAVLQLSRGQGTLEIQQAVHDVSEGEPICTPTEQCFVQSYKNPLVASASTTALAMLPLCLWREWMEKQDDSEEGQYALREHQHQHQPKLGAASQARKDKSRSEEERNFKQTGEAAAAHSYATACTLTKQMYKWEAHIAAYVCAQLSNVESSSQLLLLSSSREDGGRSALVTDADAAFLLSVQAELNVLRGACNAAQLLWLTIESALHPLPPTSFTEQQFELLTEVTKRCTKVEKLLRSLLANTATARLLLPGVLLWQGFLTDRRTFPDTLTTPSPQCISCWQQALSLGQQTLSASHPFVEAMIQLVSQSSVLRPPQKVEPKSPESRTKQRQQPFEDFQAGPSNGAAYRAATPFTPAEPPSRTYAPPLLPLPCVLPPVAQQYKEQHHQQFPMLPQRTTAMSTPRPYPSLPPPRMTTTASATTPTTLPPRPPDYTHAFTTAFAPALNATNGNIYRKTFSSFSSPYGERVRQLPTLRPMRELPDRKGNANASAAVDFSNTFPPSRTAPSAEVGDATANPAMAAAMSADGERVAGFTAAAPHSQRPLKARGRQQKQIKPRRSGLAALRNCHRLNNPADAFRLTSSVQDAVYDDDLAHGSALGRFSGKRKKKGKKKCNADTIASTEALLLSADATDSTSALNDVASGVNAEHGRRQRQPRRRRPDRQLLPPLTEVKRTLDGNQSHLHGPSNPDDVLSPSNDQLSPFMRGDEPFWRGSTRDGSNDGRSAGGAVTPAGAGIATRKNTVNSQTDNYAGSTNRHRSDGEGDDNTEQGDDVAEEEDEEDYDVETLPERNARLQREVRTYFVQLNERRVHAAAVIQRAWRCSKARQTLQARQQVLYRYVYIIQKAAALAIESFVRCVWAQRQRRAVVNSRATSDVERSALERRQIAAANVMTRAARQWLQRRRERRRLRAQLNLEHDARLKQYEVASVVVQRWWRGIQPRKAYWRRRNAELAEEKRRQAEAARVARAATTIQSRVRGVQARSRVNALKRRRAAEAHALQLQRDAAVTVLIIVLQEHARRQARLTREAAAQQALHESAAARIVENWQVCVARRRVDVAVQRARQLRMAATCIQRVWRRYIAGRQRRYLRQIRRTLLEERIARERQVSTSAVQLQCAARGAVAQLLVQQMRARVGRSFIDSVMLLQAVSRGMQARQVLGQTRLHAQARQRAEASALAQRQFHAACLAQVLLRAHQSSHLIQQRRQRQLEEKLHVYSAAAREMRQDAAATVMQRAVRRHQQRQRNAKDAAEAAIALQYLNERASRVQRAWRCYVARQERQRRTKAVLRSALKRREQEEVLELIWRDQKRELDVLCTLEKHSLAEAEHAARVALYRTWMFPSVKPMRKKNSTCGRNNQDNLGHWAALYVD